MGRSTLKHLAIAFVTFLGAGAVLGAMSYVVIQKEQALQDQRIAVHKQMQQEEAFKKLQRLADESKGDRATLDSYFIHKESDSIDVLTLVEGLAPKAGIHLETKSLQKVTDKDTKTDWIEISFDLSGSRADVERFLSVLEHLPYLSYMTSSLLNQRSGDGWQALVTLRVYIANYGSK
jgi:hypothetical protein